MSFVSNIIEYCDDRFYHLVIPVAELEELYDGCRWAEGPVWFNDHRMLIWSDIPNRRLLRWTEEQGVSVYRSESNFTNGNFRDLQGRLLSCEHGRRCISRTEADGSVTILADRHAGGRLNSPNDLVVKSDGSIWFTDPDYGILSDYEGFKSDSEQSGCHVFRLDPRTGELNVVADDFVKPNGLAFAKDESRLYIADSGRSHDPNGPHHLRVFDVVDGQRLANGRTFYQVEPGVPDGLRVDSEDNVWCSCLEGVLCIDSAGKLLGKLRIPQMVSNLTFGGPRKNRLFITATKSLYAIYLATTGVQFP